MDVTYIHEQKRGFGCKGNLCYNKLVDLLVGSD